MAKLHLGTIGWSYNFWKGTFYPAKMPSKDFLAYYASRFITVEVDSTFYRIPTEQTVTNWKNQTPKGFKFALKFPQRITHVKMFNNVQPETDTFLESVKFLGEKLGPLLIQLSPNFGVDRFADLEKYLQKLPKHNLYVVEVRNKGWLRSDFYSLLKTYNVALAWADSPLMLPTSEVTAHFLYMRWEGDRKAVNGTLSKVEVDKTSYLAVWAKKLKTCLDGGMEVFGYFSKYYSGFPPSDIDFLGKELGQEYYIDKQNNDVEINKVGYEQTL
jgi:uncharacterized protein YecE (DUF72 family)